MEKFHKIRPLRIFLWMFFFVILTVVLFNIDTRILQKSARIYISQYNDILMVIWQVQATISALALTATAYIIGRVNVTYYGVCIKDLLHLKHGIPQLFLSFWESIIVDLLLLVVTGLFVFFGNMLSVVISALTSLYLTIRITLECISVVSESKKYNEQARLLVEGLVGTILKEHDAFESEQSHVGSKSTEVSTSNIKETAREHFSLILDKYAYELDTKIRSGVDLHHDPFFDYYIEILDRLYHKGEQFFSSTIFEKLNTLLRTAIEQRADKNIATIVNSSLDTTNNQKIEVLRTFLYSYYDKYVEPRCFNNVLDARLTFIRQGDNNQFLVALELIRLSLVKFDEETFKKTIQAVYSIPVYRKSSHKGAILLISFAYLYYLSFRESEFVISKGSSPVLSLKNYIHTIIIENIDENQNLRVSNIVADSKLMLSDIDCVIDYFKTHNLDWEFSFFQSKRLTLKSTIIDFISFIFMVYYNGRSPKLDKIDLDTLLEIKTHVNNDGCVEKNFQESFSVYCSWLSTTYKSDMKNTAFLNILTSTIKEKLINKAVIDRDIRKSSKGWLGKKREAELKELRTSSVFTLTPDMNCFTITDSFCEIEYNRSIIHEQTYTYSAENTKQRIEYIMFSAAKTALDCFIFDAEYEHSDESLTNFEKLLEQSKQNGLTIDQSYNYSFFSEAEYFPFSVATRERFNKLKSQFRNCGEFSQGRGFPVYTDSSKPKFGFGVDETNFLEFREDLSDEDLDQLLLEYKAQDTYLYNGNYPDVQLRYSEAELRELLRISAVKIIYHFVLYIPMEKIGFFTINKQEVETTSMLES